MFNLELADLSVQLTNLRLANLVLAHPARLKDACSAVHQHLLPVVDLVGMHIILHRQLGDRPIALERRHRHLRLERGAVLLPRLLHCLLLQFRAIWERALTSPPVSFPGTTSNTDQGSQFTSDDFIGVLKRDPIKISMDGKGRCMDNVFVERLWRSLKYEEVYLHAYASVSEAKSGIGSWLHFYNE